MLATKSPYIQSAYEQLQLISQDKTKRFEYEAREKAIRDHNQLLYEAEERGREKAMRDYNQLMYEAEERGMQRGMKEGIQQEKLEIAMKLYSQGWKLEDISGIVDISVEVLEEKIVEKK